MADKQIIERPYNGYSRLEDENGNPIAYVELPEFRRFAYGDRDLAEAQLMLSCEIVWHLRQMTGQKPTETDIKEMIS